MRGLNLKDKVFNKLTVLEISHKDAHNNYHWNCLCDCGKTCVVKATRLKTGKTKSCGCLQSEVKKVKVVHGLSTTPTYRAWIDMKSRCLSTSSCVYSDYGGRGITVCDRWSEPAPQGFLNFLEDMGERPSHKHSLDRVDVNGNYDASNCRWSERSLQSHNTRSHKGSSSKYKGVHLTKRKDKWCAQVRKDGKIYHLGYFEDEIMAATAYNMKALELFGVVASLNTFECKGDKKQAALDTVDTLKV